MDYSSTTTMYRIEQLKNDPNWIRSIGEKLDKIHFRNGNWHAECDPATGYCSMHYDKYDPHKSPTELVRHMWDSKLGKFVLLGAAAVSVGAVVAELASRR